LSKDPSPLRTLRKGRRSYSLTSNLRQGGKGGKGGKDKKKGASRVVSEEPT